MNKDSQGKLVGMMLTALSYGRMASRYPSAGSAYTYLGIFFGFQFGVSMNNLIIN